MHYYYVRTINLIFEPSTTSGLSTIGELILRSLGCVFACAYVVCMTVRARARACVDDGGWDCY